LQGIATGLAALAGRVHAAFVCSTDLPFLHPAFVRRVLTALTGDLDVILPVARGYPQPLAAAYRVTLAPLLAELLAAGERRLTLLFGRCTTLRVDDAALLADPALATADPALESVVNVNTPDEYQAARQRLAPQVTVQAVTTNSRCGPCAVRAATLFGAAAAVGLTSPSRLVTTLNSSAIDSDGDVPLITGDNIVFSCPDAGG
jgi:molybdopterin-guanine dinucleotide biosynthesis protein A